MAARRRKNDEITTIVHNTLQKESILNDSETLVIDDEWNEERKKLAEELLEKDKILVKPFWQQKYEKEAAKNWDKFYQRNGTNFYKDRHYIHKIFQELDIGENFKMEKRYILEVGCGVGNAALPLLELNKNLHAICIDFSTTAIELLKGKPELPPERCNAYVCDITNDPLPDEIERLGGVDYALLFFCLSSIHPDKMRQAVAKIAGALKPGGKLLFRDYGRYDQAQLRFQPGSKLSDHFYVRQDLTRAYYFTTEEVSELFSSCGLIHEENQYIRRQYSNRQQKNLRFRVWLHAKFYKPL